MATTVDELITKYTLDPSGYVTGGAVVTRTTKTIDDDVSKAAGGMRTAFDEIGRGLQVGLGVATTFFTALTGLAAAYVGFGAAAMKAAADHEALVMGLRAVVGDAKRAEVALRELRAAARAPGIGQEEAISGFSKLVNAGMSETMSLEAIKQFANANALAGGGKEQFGRILLALSQIANTPFLQGDELRQFSEANIPAHRLVRERFGTADTEQLKAQGITSSQVIKGLIEDLSKFQRVAGGAKNEFENAGDAWNYMQVQIGTPLNELILPAFNKMADVMDQLSESGAMKTFVESLTSFLTIPQEAAGIKDMFFDILEVTLAIGFGLRNAVMNLQDLWNTFKPWWLRQLEHGEDSPTNEAKKVTDAMRKQMEVGEGYDSERFPGWKVRRKGNGGWEYLNPETKAWQDTSPGGWRDPKHDEKLSDKDKMTEKASVADRIAEYTRQTAENTRAMREAMRDAIIGGGFFGSKGVTHREAARFVNSVVDSRV